MQMDALTALRTLALATSLSLRDALAVVDALGFQAVSAVNLTTHDGRVAFARTSPAIQDAVNSGRKIQAIKELRQAGSNAGQPVSLKEAKDAIDVLSPPQPYRPSW